MINNFEVGKAILDMHGYQNVKFITSLGLSEYCKMTKDGNATISLRKESTKDEAIHVASHEVGHFLTYTEGISDPHKLKRWNLYMGFSFATIIISSISFLFLNKVIFYIILPLLIMGSLFVALKYLSMYVEDEILAEKRGLKEMYALQEQLNTTFNMAKIESLVENNIRKNIVGFVKKFKMTLTCLPIISIIIKVILISY
ncbi:hypothetical protein [Cytobacillus praedii]|uniref:hypothetical protein n=1 Tax=Cytobacillus praedii TaxID=1742358 RepID=UPI002E1BFD1C|nr:hypothetical protein [Cytobacillus praedii]